MTILSHFLFFYNFFIGEWKMKQILRNFRLGKMVFAGFSILLIFITFLVFIEKEGLNNIETDALASKKIAKILSNITKIKFLEEEFILQKKDIFSTKIKETNKKTDNNLNTLSMMVKNEKKTIKTIKKQNQKYLKLFQQYEANPTPLAIKAMNEGISKEINELTKLSDNLHNALKNTVKATQNESTVVFLIVFANSLFFGFLIFYAVNSNIKEILNQSTIIKESIGKGDLDTFVDIEILSKDFKSVGEILNGIVETITPPIKLTSEIVEKISIGDIPQKIAQNFEGEFGKIKNSLNNLIDANQTIVSHSEKIAEGNLKVEISHRSPEDKLFMAFKKMVTNTGNLIKELLENIQSLASSGEELSAISGELVSGSDTVSEQMNTVASASEELSSNISGIAAASEEMGINSANVAQNAKQMAQAIEQTTKDVENLVLSIKEVKENANETKEIALETKNESKKATLKMTELNIAAQEIDKVTEIIKDIAGQTNLLALNATIEATSAGEPGKGFAVVANEIKELARQSATAATEIGEKLNDVQNKTKEAVEEMDKIEEIVDTINIKIENINKTVENQFITSENIKKVLLNNVGDIKDVAQLIAEITETINEVSKNTGEGALASDNVSKTILEVEAVSKETLNGASQVASASEELAVLAENIQKMISTFQV